MMLATCLAYRMSRDQRVHDNWALLRACEVAKETGSPVLVAFNLVWVTLQVHC